MQAPYTDNPVEVFNIAQAGAAVLLTLTGVKPLMRTSPRVLAAWLSSVWVAALALPLAGLLMKLKLTAQTAAAELHLLSFALALQLLALVVSRNRRALLAGLPVLSLVFLGRLFVPNFNSELLAAASLSAGWVLALLAAPREPQPPDTTPSRPKADLTQDLALFALGTLAGAIVADVVLLRGIDSSDEWGYTYQAAVMAKGQLYGKVPACLPALRNFWIFWRDGRMFAQYQPGWPLFMVPFVWANAVWLAGPVSLGVLAVAIARLTRRALRELPGLGDAAVRRAAWFASLALLTSNTILVNGGSRYLHVFVLALFALIVEVTWALRGRVTRQAALWPAVALGTLAGWLFISRIPDAVLWSVGPLAYLVVACVRRTTHWSAVPVALLAAAPWVLFLLWSGHVQVGGWGKLPYMIAPEFHGWAVVRFSFPALVHFKWAIPIASGLYEWWPMTPALGVFGLVLAARQKPLRRVAFTLGLSALTSFVFYFMLEFGRGGDFGYGPRYQMVLVVPMAVGFGLVMDYLLTLTRSRVMVVSCVALIFAAGVVLIGKNKFDYTHRVLEGSTAIDRAVAQSTLQNAIVVVPGQVAGYFYGPWDVTRNYPIELYNPRVIIANGYDTACLVREYPDRAIYRAAGTLAKPELIPIHR